MLYSINPYDHTTIALYEEDSSTDVKNKIDLAYRTRFDRTAIWPMMHRLAHQLKEDRESLAKLMTEEMGKPITQSRAEIDKCVWMCEYYADHSEAILADKIIPTEGSVSFVRRAPFGVWLAIMPWNFPFWQVLRCAVPAICAGNRVLLKHASNVTGCALAIENTFKKAGFDKGIFQVLKVKSTYIGEVLTHRNIAGLSLTGSDAAGRQAAAKAATHLKPQILELGGSNAFIVCKDADLDKAVDQAIIGRFQNSGQSCIAAKRILVATEVYDEFIERFIGQVKKIVYGNPMSEYTFVGPLAQVEGVERLHRQVLDSVEQGAIIAIGGKRVETMYEPTVLINVSPGMTCMQQELFGPVVSVMRVNSMSEAISVSNGTGFGLGVSIFTEDVETALSYVDEFDEGAVFINSIVKSDPRLPFGGIKNSGYGRELSAEGLLAFTQAKTVYGA